MGRVPFSTRVAELKSSLCASPPSTVHDESHYRLWQRRFYPFNVYSDKKFQEKLDYMHNNPVERRLVSSPSEWPWSSWRFYYLEDASILRMDRRGWRSLRDRRLHKAEVCASRVNVVNLLNHPNFGQPAADISSTTTVGTISSQVAPVYGNVPTREIDFNLRFDF
jgi:hypothetical protein